MWRSTCHARKPPPIASPSVLAHCLRTWIERCHHSVGTKPHTPIILLMKTFMIWWEMWDQVPDPPRAGPRGRPYKQDQVVSSFPVWVSWQIIKRGCPGIIFVIRRTWDQVEHGGIRGDEGGLLVIEHVKLEPDCIKNQHETPVLLGKGANIFGYFGGWCDRQ